MPTTTAQTLLDQTTATVSELQDAAAISLSGLESIVQGNTLTWFDFAGLPAPPVITVPTVAIGSIGTLTAPTISAAPTFDYTPDSFAVLKAQVLALIESGGADISPTIQNAIFNQGIERDIQTQRQALDLAGAATGSKGFRIPNGQTAALQGNIINTFGYRKADQSREITRTMGELAQRNLQMAISAGVSIEEALASVAVKTFEVMIEAQRLVIEKFKTEAQVAIEIFKGNLEVLTSNLSAEVTTQKLNIEAQNLQVDEWKTNVNALVEKGKAQISQAEEANRIRIAAVDGLVRAYQGIANTMSSQGVTITTQST